ncbi:uncharacterized protein LOC119081930 [Bradysia coprophila]|uniref:uncharacterized protein LOC119081930 n=1 Tax=Bradysia coprophila TaxID=38358 RepID=UPI00187DCB0D|nr:uncharacterized protein LOC119081930 [Bradysia coprophila]
MSSDLKRQRRASESGDDDQLEKRPKIADASLSTSSDLAQAINLELSHAVTFKRTRSTSNEPVERNVRARLTVDLSSSNPEHTSFLMGAIANELENISQMLSSPDASRSRVASPSSSPSRSHSQPSSTSSSPDYYDRLVADGYELMDRMRQDPGFAKYF